MSIVATLKALAAAGGTPEQLIAVVEAHEAAKSDALSKRRADDAARQQAARDRKNNVTSRDGHVTARDSRDPSPHVGASAQVVTPSLPSLRSEEVVVVVGERERAPETVSPEDWPPGDAREHARLIVEAVASPWLDPTKSLDLHTSAGRLVAWRKAGASWEHDVLAVVAGVCAKRRSRVGSWKYFDEAVANSIADNRAALQIPEASGNRPTGPPGGLTDRIAAEHAEARRRALAN